LAAHLLYFGEFNAEQNRILRLLKVIFKSSNLLGKGKIFQLAPPSLPQVPKLVFFLFPPPLLRALRDTAEVVGAAIESLPLLSDPSLVSTFEPVGEESEGRAEPFSPEI
jgi:hypothetical protein